MKTMTATKSKKQPPKEPQKAVNVIKPRELIHIERKAPKLALDIFNVLVKCAWSEIKERKKHSVPLRTLINYIPSARNVKHLRKLLDTLDVKVKYNIFGRVKSDRKAEGYFVLVPEAAIIIENGVGRIEYSFTHTMIEIFSDPKMYAKINLLIQSRFKKKYSSDLYELCFDYKDNYNNMTPWLPVDELKSYLGIAETETYKSFKFFNQFVLKPAVKDVSSKYTDITIKQETRKKGRKITDVRFHIKTKKNFQLALPIANELPEPELETAPQEQKPQKSTEPKKVSQSTKTTTPPDNLKLTEELKNAGVSAGAIKEIIKEYSAEEIKEAIQSYKEAEQKEKGVSNPTGFIQTALKEGWQSQATIKKRKQQAVELKRQAKIDEQEAERRGAEEAIKQEEERYANSTDEEKFEHILKVSTSVREGYEALTPDNQNALREYAYNDVFPSFHRFGNTFGPLTDEGRRLRRKQK